MDTKTDSEWQSPIELGLAWETAREGKKFF